MCIVYTHTDRQTLSIVSGGGINLLAVIRKISGDGFPFLTNGLSLHIACDKHLTSSGLVDIFTSYACWCDPVAMAMGIPFL